MSKGRTPSEAQVAAVKAHYAEALPMTDNPLRAEVHWAITTLDQIVEMVESGGDIPTEITIVQNRLRAALAASTPMTDDTLRAALERVVENELTGLPQWRREFTDRLYRAALAASAPDEGPNIDRYAGAERDAYCPCRLVRWPDSIGGPMTDDKLRAALDAAELDAARHAIERGDMVTFSPDVALRVIPALAASATDEPPCRGKSDDRWLCETHPGGMFSGQYSGGGRCSLAASATDEGPREQEREREMAYSHGYGDGVRRSRLTSVTEWLGPCCAHPEPGCVTCGFVPEEPTDD